MSVVLNLDLDESAGLASQIGISCLHLLSAGMADRLNFM